MPDLLSPLSVWAGAVGGASLQAALGIAGVLAAGALAPRLSGTTRSWLWRLAFARVLLALFWSVPITLPAPSPIQRAAPTLEVPGVEALPSRSRTPPVEAERASQPWGPRMVLAVCWIVGVGWCVLLAAGHVRQAQRLLRESRPVTDPRLLERWDELRALFDQQRPVRLREAAELKSPLLLGGFRPVVLLPVGLADAWSPEQIRLMLAHELAHVRRHDLLWGWLPALTHAALFFHPLVWIGGREWRLAHDCAADELALRITGAPVAEYARLLVGLAGARRGASVGLALMDARDSARTLERRLKLMNPSRNPRPAGRPGRQLSALFLGACIAIPVHVIAQPNAPEPFPQARTPFVGNRLADAGQPTSVEIPSVKVVRGGDTARVRNVTQPNKDAEIADQKRIGEVERRIRALARESDQLVKRNRELEQLRRQLDQEVRDLEARRGALRQDDGDRARRADELRARETVRSEQQAIEAEQARRRALEELDRAERELQAALARVQSVRAVAPPAPASPGQPLEFTVRLLRQRDGAERVLAVLKVLARENEWIKVQLPTGKVIDADEASTRPPDVQFLQVRGIRDRGKLLIQIDWPAGGGKQLNITHPGDVVRFEAAKDRLAGLDSQSPQAVEVSIETRTGR